MDEKFNPVDHRGLACHAIRRRFGWPYSHPDFEDYVQEIYLLWWKYRHQHDPLKSRWQTWAFKIAYRELNKLEQKRLRRGMTHVREWSEETPPLVLAGASLEVVVAPAPDGDLLAKQDTVEKVRRLLGGLDTTTREFCEALQAGRNKKAAAAAAGRSHCWGTKQCRGKLRPLFVGV